jgi:hypothetical protein
VRARIDPGRELKQLCGTIVAGQQAEIDQLRAKLAALGG